MRVIFFSKCSKFDGDFTNGVKSPESFFCFLDYCIWIDCCIFSLLQREYLSSAVNMVANSPKISDITKGDIFEFYFSESEEKIWKN